MRTITLFNKTEFCDGKQSDLAVLVSGVIEIWVF